MNHAAPSQKTFGHILGQQYTVFDGLAGMYVEAIYQDRHGLLWIGTTDGGISRFDGAHFDTFGLSDGLPHLSVTTIVEDADGRLLFGTFGGGLAAYDGRGFQAIHERSYVMTHRSLLIACLATLGLAVAGWGQADGKIAFTSGREGAGDVWIMNADGSDPVNLTQGRHGLCVSPAWSPDGTKIAYLAFSADPASGQVDYSIGDVWVMDADGGNSQQMGSLTNPGRAYPLIWAEDGSLIYSVKYLTGRYEVFVVPLDGSGSSLMDWREAAWIVRGPVENLGRSPDGTKLASVVLQDSEGDAYLRLLIFTSSEWPYEREDRMNLVEDSRKIPLDLPQQTGLELEPGSFVPSNSEPTWSPDSMRIAFSARNEQRDEEVWVVDIDGSNLVNLTNGLGGDYPAWQPVSPSATATSVEAQSWGRIKALLSH